MNHSISVVFVLIFCGFTATSCGSSLDIPRFRFADHDGELPPSDEYDGPLFKLSQDYPNSTSKPDKQPWLEVDPVGSPDAYQLAIREYFLAGMVEADFRVENNRVRKWYHMPWMHVGRNPRESIRGLTNERASRCHELGPQQNKRQQNWGIGFFNSMGGYTVGRVWSDPQKPNPEESQFLEGTVVVKLLFSDAPDSRVPDLQGAPTWTAFIRKAHDSCDDSRKPREVRQVRLLQMDFAVKDRRAGITGWFFGSLVYEKSASGVDAWRKLVPSGLQWGLDHGYGSKDQESGKRLRETYISDPKPKLTTYKEELGWLGRLNGPIDNSVSSCMSCHSTAQWPDTSGMTPLDRASEQERMRWFRSLAGDEAFASGNTPLDYSLQMRLSLSNFYKEGDSSRSSGLEKMTPFIEGQGAER